MRYSARHIFLGCLLPLGISFATLLAQALTAFLTLSGQKVYDSLAVGELLASVFVADALSFLLALLLVHLLLSVLVFLVWRYTSVSSLRGKVSRFYWLLLLGISVLFLANRCFFPQSFFSGNQDAPEIFWWLLWGVGSGWIILAFGGVGRQKWPVLLVAFALLGSLGGRYLIAEGVARSGRQAPDIILVGFDSLRPDVVGPRFTPVLDRYLRSAVVFPDAITPMARTYPAWMSILSGVDPVKHGARFNLIPDHYLNRDYRLLPEYLGALGYQSLLAMDERRFANFSERHGFSQIVGPKAGISEFLLAAASDIPLVNFVRRLPVAEQLFPFIHANRAAFFSYWGDEYVGAIGRSLSALDDSRPALLITHFCKGHWPYAFVGARSGLIDPVAQGDRVFGSYLAAVGEADQQFEAVMERLRTAGRLENALVFFLSDHGESFRQDGLDMKASVHSERAFKLLSSGHGTHASIPAQYSVLLAYQRFAKGVPVTEAVGRVMGRVSLVDVLPSVLDYLKLPPVQGLDGRSLLEPPSLSRDFFVESGFSVPAMLNARPDAKAAFQQGAGFYRVQADGTVELKSERVPTLIEHKEYSLLGDGDAVVYGSYMSGRQGFRILDFRENTWGVVDESSPFELRQRAAKLCRHFGSDSRLQRDPLCRLVSHPIAKQ